MKDLKFLDENDFAMKCTISEKLFYYFENEYYLPSETKEISFILPYDVQITSQTWVTNWAHVVLEKSEGNVTSRIKFYGRLECDLAYEKAESEDSYIKINEKDLEFFEENFLEWEMNFYGNYEVKIPWERTESGKYQMSLSDEDIPLLEE